MTGEMAVCGRVSMAGTRQPLHLSSMLEWMLFRVIMVAFFILATSFFVAAEFALVSVRETRIQQLIALGRPGARTALKLKHSINAFLPAVQLCVTAAALPPR